MRVREPSALTRAKSVHCQTQLDELRKHYGNKVCAHLLAIREASVYFKRQPPMTWRAVQFLHVLTFHQGKRVNLADILTSFRYNRPSAAIHAKKPQEARACGFLLVENVGGDGI